MTMSPWSPRSWRERPVEQMPRYPDEGALEAALEELRRYPPLVFAGEARSLRRELAQASRGEAFVLQGGDCAESFAEFHPHNIRDTLKVMLQMAAVLTFGAQTPVVKIGRLAGQFAKPRSQALERRGEVALPSYRGDIINGSEFEEAARRPDPARLLRAYTQAAATLNLVRAMTKGGYADLTRVHQWNMEFTAHSGVSRRYQETADRIEESLRFMRACGLNPEDLPQLQSVDLYTSHEALLLGYEEALTRVDSTSGDWYDTSAHLVWIGNRTRQVEGAHVEFARGISNPVAVKIGPGVDGDALLRLVDVLNPANEAGRLTVITRFGADEVARWLPPLLRAARGEGRALVWICDAMHGNTVASPEGYKTRHLTSVLAEIRAFFAVHRAEGTIPGGIHLEMTGLNVTECVGGELNEVRPESVGERYQTRCDPRLNATQALEVAFETAALLKQR
jgi:3-deoxy-7-phosphoheptulonate synthase